MLVSVLASNLLAPHTEIVFTQCIADGQKIVKRLARQIAKESKIIKNLLLEHNSCCLSDDNHCLTLTSAYNLECLSNLLMISHSSPERARRQEIIEEYYYSSMRSHEEIELLISEVQNAIQFYTSRIDKIEAEFFLQSKLSEYNIRAKVLLNSLLHNTSKLHQDMMSTYTIMKEENVMHKKLSTAVTLTLTLIAKS